jgi:hypothetical protein
VAQEHPGVTARSHSSPGVDPNPNANPNPHPHPHPHSDPDPDPDQVQQHALVKLRQSNAGPPFALMPWLTPIYGAAQRFDDQVGADTPCKRTTWSEVCPDGFDPLMCSIRVASLVLEAEAPGSLAYNIFLAYMPAVFGLPAWRGGLERSTRPLPICPGLDVTGLCFPSPGRPGGLTYSGVKAWLCGGGHADARTYAYEVQGAKAFEDMPRSNVPGALSGTSRTLLMAAANDASRRLDPRTDPSIHPHPNP